MHPAIHPLIHTSIHPSSHPLINPFCHFLFIHLSINPFIHSSILPSIPASIQTPAGTDASCWTFHTFSRRHKHRSLGGLIPKPEEQHMSVHLMTSQGALMILLSFLMQNKTRSDDRSYCSHAIKKLSLIYNRIYN